MIKKLLAISFAVTALISSSAQADDKADYVLTIKDHKFSPANLVIPANQKVKIIVKNQDATAEEFESSDLDREKVVDGNKEITVFIGPLSAGTYGYFGDFHRDSATGTITAK